MNTVGTIAAILAMISAVIAADARYTKYDDLTDIKDEIINEMRREVTKNRSVMIGSMRREADNLEFQMLEYERKDKNPPRYIIEKHKQIKRQIDSLQTSSQGNEDE